MQAAFCAGMRAPGMTENEVMGNHRLAFLIQVTGNPAVGEEVCACSVSGYWYPRQYNR